MMWSEVHRPQRKSCLRRVERTCTALILNFIQIEICDILEFALGSIWAILFLGKIEHPSERGP